MAGVRSRLNAIHRTLKQLTRPTYVDYVGGTATLRDALRILYELRKGESLFDGAHRVAYEAALADFHGGANAVSFGAGNMALYAILKSLDLKPDGEVILPGYTCIVVPNAIRFAGLLPRYVDVSLDDFNMMPEQVEAAIGPKTVAILAQATFGIPCDMDALGDISKRSGVPIIEDGAHGIGARWDGHLIGERGVAAFFSTQATKMFSTERGGYAITHDSALASRLRQVQEQSPFLSERLERQTVLRWCYRACMGRRWMAPRLRWFEQRAKRRGKSRLLEILDHDREIFDDALQGRRPSSYPLRLGNLMALAGKRQLTRIEVDLMHRRKLAELLELRLPAYGAKVASFDRRAEPSWVRYPFVVEDRDRWMKSMRRAGFAAGVWLNDPIHPRGSNQSGSGYTPGQCPNGEYLADHILNVPLHQGTTARKLNRWLVALDKELGQ